MIDLIIPTYKPSIFLKECLFSIESQTIDFELFNVTIVLNGERDPFYSEIQDILSECSFSYSLIYTETKGVSNARNIGIESTKFPYVVFLDDDDVLSENYLEQIISYCDAGSIVVSNVLSFNKKKQESEKDYLSFNEKFQSENIIKYRRYLSNSCCKLIPRLMIGNNRFDPKVFKGEDALFMFSLSNKINKIVSTEPNVIYFRRLRPLSASRIKYSVLKEIVIGLQQQKAYSLIYLRNLKSYSFLLYLTRILAVIKAVFLRFKTYFKG